MVAVDSKIVVNAYGYSAGGVAPHFRLLIDGKDAGQATVSATSPTAYTFTAPIEAGQPHQIQVYYDNDDFVNGQDRNLGVKSIVVNGNTLLPTQASYDRYDLDGQDVVAGQEGMWWQGALNFNTPATYYPAPAPTPTSTTGGSSIVVNASGTPAGGVNAHFKVLVDGKQVGEGTAGTTAKDFTFKADVSPGAAHKVQIQYDNDGTVNGVDRNLYVNKITINDKAVLPNASNVTYDKFGLDGKDVIAGQSAMKWAGTMEVAADKSYFPGSDTTSTSTPTSTTGSSSITVNASGTPAGGVNAHFKVLIDGKQIGEGTAGTTAKDFTFKTDVSPDAAHKVQIQYDNDATVDGVDRNLYVNKITINDKAVLPNASNVTYDKFALDGKDVVAGQSAMKWAGTMEVAADKSYFPGSTTTTSGTPSLSVSNVSVNEPGVVNDSTITGFLHTDGNQIVDSTGKNVKLTGINWFGGEGYNYVPAGLWADSYQHHLESMKSLGFNVIRMTFSDEMFDSSAVTNGIDYSKNPDLMGLTRLQVYDKVIDYAGKMGMKVILDHHRNDGGAGTNESGLWYSSAHPESKMIENWKMLANHYKGNTTVIGADLHNEPSVSATWGDGNAATDWAAAAQRIGNAIQTVNKDWLLLVEGPEWSSNMAGVANHQVTFDTPGKLVYSPHVYAQSVAQFPWLNAADYPNNLPAQYDGMWGYIYKNNIAPVMLGEFGGQMNSSAEQAWASALMKYTNGDWNLDGKTDIAAGKQGIGWTYWAWTPESGDVGGILNADYTVNQSKVNLIKAGMYTGAGTPGQTDALFTVKLSAPATSTVKVNYDTVDGTAKAGSDYAASHGTLTFNPGETTKTVAVKVLGDSVSEGSETFSLKLSSPTAATLANGTGTATIIEKAASAQAQADVYNHLVAQEQPAPASAEAEMAAQTVTVQNPDMPVDPLHPDPHHHQDTHHLG